MLKCYRPVLMSSQACVCAQTLLCALFLPSPACDHEGAVLRLDVSQLCVWSLAFPAQCVSLSPMRRGILTGANRPALLDEGDCQVFQPL